MNKKNTENDINHQKKIWKNYNLKSIGKKILIIILILWLVVSAGYIVREQVVRFINHRF
jgi:preprotein translocase subunit Sec63